MNVRELIELLEGEDPEAEVRIAVVSSGEYMPKITQISRVESGSELLWNNWDSIKTVLKRTWQDAGLEKEVETEEAMLEEREKQAAALDELIGHINSAEISRGWLKKPAPDFVYLFGGGRRPNKDWRSSQMPETHLEG